MPITTGDFQDLVQLSQDTLYYVGADFEIGNTSVGSSASIGFNNTAGDLQLVGVATGNATAWLPVAGGTLATQVTLSNSNNLSFGLNVSTITASAWVNVSAGTTSNNLSAVTFSNSNGVSFGLNGSVVTASALGVNFSAGTTSNNLTGVTFSNSNNLSFGLNGSTVTASAPVNFSAAGASANLTNLVFSNAGGVTFGLAGSTITASAIVGSVTQVVFSAGTTSNSLSSVVFSNTYNVSFGLNGSTITASANRTGDWYDNIARAQPLGSASGEMGSMSNFTGSVSTLFVQPLHGYGELFPYDMTANTCFFPDVSISGSTATMSVAFTSKWFLGIYTLNGSSLSLLNSVSISFGFAGAATNNSTGFAGGYRYATIHSSLWSSTPVFNYGSRYWLAWFWSSSGILNQTGAMAGAFMFSTGQRSGLLGVSNLTATSNGAAPFYGIYTAQTAALPVSIGSNQLQKTASIAGFQPHLIMAQNASLTVF